MIALAIAVGIGCWFHAGSLHDFPTAVHAWAQSDHLALAQGFVRNGLNFFKPTTWYIVPEYAHIYQRGSLGGITAVDFPIHDYIPAVFMKLTGSDSPMVMRLYTLLYSWFGLFMLFRLGKLLTNSFAKSLFVMLFAATSPVWVYYQAGFLPTIPSLANTFAGLYFYALYIKFERPKHLYAGLAFLVLAALARTTFVIPLIAVLLAENLRAYTASVGWIRRAIVTTVPLMAVLGYMYYNHLLRNTYGSVFLNFLLPAGGLGATLDVLCITLNNWMYHYFSPLHYVIILAFITIIAGYAIHRRGSLQVRNFWIWLTAAFHFAGSIAFFFAMALQFPDHDYYFLDAFFVPVILLLILFMSLLPTIYTRYAPPANTIFILFFGIYGTWSAAAMQMIRYDYKPSDMVWQTIRNFDGSAALLDSIGVQPDARILVIAGYAPNIPLMLMQRTGFNVMQAHTDTIARALTWDFDYIATQNENFHMDVFRPYPEIIHRVKPIGNNGRITIFSLVDSSMFTSVKELLTYGHGNPAYSQFNDFKHPVKGWYHNSGEVLDGEEHIPSAWAVRESEYPAGFQMAYNAQLYSMERLLIFRAGLWSVQPGSLWMVVDILGADGSVHYKAWDVDRLLHQNEDWEEITVPFRLPAFAEGQYTIQVYFWNPEQAEAYIDFAEIEIY